MSPSYIVELSSTSAAAPSHACMQRESRKEHHILILFASLFVFMFLSLNQAAGGQDGDESIVEQIERMGGRLLPIGGPGRHDLMVDISESSLDDGSIVLLNDLRNMRGFAALRPRVSQKGLDKLRNLNEMLDLRTDGIGLDRAFLRRVFEAKELEVLILSNAGIAGDDLEGIQNLMQLEQLVLSHNRISKNSINKICKLKQLQKLFLSAAEIDDGGVEMISRELPQLEVLDVDQNSLTDKAVASISRLGHIKELNLSYTKISDASARIKGQLGFLDTLVLSGCAITDRFLDELEGGARLGRLFLANTRVTGRGLARLKRFQRLEVLILRGLSLSNPDLDALTSCTNLQVLDLSGTSITDSGLLRLVKVLPSLRDLSIRDTVISDKCIKSLLEFNAGLQIDTGG